ncbi:hypothetical protein JL721_11442 [Aureococcus anophagefferens]|nr:hypothetical protein JL721_11442 [Aureococcus anophagefferens]
MAAHPCVLARLREAAPRRGSTVTAIAASRLGVACAFASRSQVPEVVVWVGSEPVAAGAGDLHAVTVVALGDRGGAPVCCFASRSGAASWDLRSDARPVARLEEESAAECGALDASGCVLAVGVGRRVELVRSDEPETLRDVAAPPPKDRTLLSYDTLHKTKRKPGMDMPITFHAKAPTLALKAGGAGARFYLDRFLLAPRTRDGRAELALFAVGLDEGRAGPGDGAARRVHAFGHGDAKRLDAVACLNGAYSPLIVTATSDRRVSVLDAAAGRRARVIDDAHARPAHDVAAPGPPAPGVARFLSRPFSARFG